MVGFLFIAQTFAQPKQMITVDAHSFLWTLDTQMDPSGSWTAQIFDQVQADTAHALDAALGGSFRSFRGQLIYPWNALKRLK